MHSSTLKIKKNSYLFAILLPLFLCSNANAEEKKIVCPDADKIKEVTGMHGEFEAESANDPSVKFTGRETHYRGEPLIFRSVSLSAPRFNDTKYEQIVCDYSHGTEIAGADFTLRSKDTFLKGSCTPDESIKGVTCKESK